MQISFRSSLWGVEKVQISGKNLISAVFLYGVEEKSKCSERISVIDKDIVDKECVRQTDRGGVELQTEGRK